MAITRKILITGTIPGYTRAQAEAKLGDVDGASIASGVEYADYIVLGEKPGPNKLAMAIKLNKDMYTWEQICDEMRLPYSNVQISSSYASLADDAGFDVNDEEHRILEDLMDQEFDYGMSSDIPYGRMIFYGCEQAPGEEWCAWKEVE